MCTGAAPCTSFIFTSSELPDLRKQTLLSLVCWSGLIRLRPLLCSKCEIKRKTFHGFDVEPPQFELLCGIFQEVVTSDIRRCLSNGSEDDPQNIC